MSSMLKNLNNIRSLRAMAREFSVDVLEDMLEKFRVVTKEQRDEEEQIQRQRAEQQAKINALLAQMQAGIALLTVTLLPPDASGLNGQRSVRAVGHTVAAVIAAPDGPRVVAGFTA